MQQLYRSPTSTVAQGVGRQGMDFMQMMQLMFAGNTPNTTGKICCNPGNGKDQTQFAASLRPTLMGELFSISGKNLDKGEDAGELLKTGEPTPIEFTALLSNEMQQSRETNFLSNSWPDAEDLVGVTGFDLDDIISKMQDALLALLEDTTAGVTHSETEGAAAQNTIASQEERLSKMLRNLLKNAGEKISNNGVQAQSLLGKIESIIGNNVSNVDLKPLAIAPAISNSEQMLFLQLAETIRGQLNQDGHGQTHFQAPNESVRQVLEQYLTLMLADKSTTSGNNVAGITPSAVEGAAAQNKIASLEEQLSIILQNLLKSASEKILNNGIQAQQVLGKIETSAGSNVSNVDVKPLTKIFTLNETTIATTAQGKVNSLPNANTALETVNNALRVDLTKVALNSADAAAPDAKPTGGETVPIIRNSEQALFLQLTEAIRGQFNKDGHGQTHFRPQLQSESLGEVITRPVHQDVNVSTHVNATNESVRTILEQYLMLMLAAKSTASGNNAAIITPSAVEGAAAQNTIASLEEQLSVILRDLLKNADEKNSINKLQTQPVLGKIEINPGNNVNNVDLKPLAPNFGLNETTIATNVHGEVNSLPNANTVSETANNAQRTDLTQVALNSVDAAATVAKPTGGETAPTIRNSEQPLFLQLSEAIRGQFNKDGHGQTNIRLQLQPKSLGEVVIRLVYKDGNVSTHFHAATEGARQIIESSLGQLRETLATHNLNLQQSTVTTGDEQGRWAHESNRERQFNRPFRQSNNEHGEREEEFSEPAIVIQSAYLNRVNHFV